MKTRITLMAAVAVVVLLLVGTVGAEPPKTEFTGTEISIATVNPGTETFPGNNNYHVRDSVELFSFTATDLRVSGENEVTVNWNFKIMPEPVYVSGRMWGTFRLTNDGGYWDGTWTGVRDANGFSYFHMVAHGGGGYEGLELKMDGERLTPDPSQPEVYVGIIIETGGYSP
ncbi:MAG TPA: hypothetical protein VFI27_22770 [candidate division Zixibacteria bacterium]|nr:hypothetical protein [candidate division Zixibacteria bacterium]